MKRKKVQARVIYFDDNNGYGYAATDPADGGGSINLFYFDLESFEYKANRTTAFDRHIECELVFSRDAKETRHLRNRYAKDGSLRELRESEKSAFGESAKDIRIVDASALGENAADLIRTNVESGDSIVIFREIDFRSPVDLKGVNAAKGCWPIFVRCTFHDIFVWPEADFDRSISFLGCAFKSRFSMKGCKVNEDVNLESCYFKGKGGVSFKELECQNLFMDRDTVGPDDEVWFNCAHIRGILSLAGSYYGNVFFESADTEPVSRIDTLFIGHVHTRATAQIKTNITGSLVLKKAKVDTGIMVTSLTAGEVLIEDASVGSLLIASSHIQKDIRLDDLRIDVANSAGYRRNSGIGIEDSRINGHLSFFNCLIDRRLSLSNTVVGAEAKIHDCRFTTRGMMDVYGFIVSRLRILPADTLFSGEKTAVSNPKFWLLKRQCEQRWMLPWLLKRKLQRIRSRGSQDAQSRGELELQRLREEYLSFKHWFSESGDLYMEDAAYYNMRHYNETSVVKYLFFNFCFGWGVRLWNVLLTAFAIIGIYTGIYVLWDKIGSIRAVVFSTESFFFGAILSDWSATLKDADKPLSGLAILSMSEGAIGVLLITVLIGAYMRKLLR